MVTATLPRAAVGENVGKNVFSAVRSKGGSRGSQLGDGEPWADTNHASLDVLNSLSHGFPKPE